MSAAVRAKPRGKSVPRSAARKPAAGGRRTRPSASATVANRGGTPPRALEAAHATHPDLNSFRSQQFPFELQVPAVTPKQPSRGDHAMARHAWLPAVSHDVADGA